MSNLTKTLEITYNNGITNSSKVYFNFDYSNINIANNFLTYDDVDGSKVWVYNA
jgi:pyruvate-formate lyase